MPNSFTSAREDRAVTTSSYDETNSVETNSGNRTLYLDRCNNIRRTIREQLTDPAYADKVVQLFNTLHWSLKDLEAMEKLGPDLIIDNSKMFKLEDVDTVPHDVSPISKDKFEKGIKLGLKKIPNIAVRTLVVKGSTNQKYGKLFYVKDTGYINAHETFSHLKHYFEAMIKDNNLNAMNLVGLDHYNNKSDGPSVITAPFQTHVLLAKFPAIQQTGLPVLALVMDYAKGFHIGSQYSYYCDAEGNVKGVHCGSNYYWRDCVNPFKAAGNHGMYKYSTLVTYGNQRIVYMYPGMNSFELPLNPTTDKTWKPIMKFGKTVKRNYPILNPAPEPRLTLGVYDMVPPERPTRTVSVPNAPQFPTLGEAPWYNRLIQCVRRTDPFLLLAIGCTIAGTSKRVPDSEKPRLLFSALGSSTLSLLYLAYKTWTKRKITVTFNLEPLYFKGKHKEALENFYAEHPIDTDTGLPYGNYWVDQYTICQVSQKGICNYTNIHKLIELYVMSIGSPKTAGPGVYLQSVPTTAPNIVKPSDNTFHTAAISPLPRITAATTYSVEVKESVSTIGVHLLNPEKYRQFIASAITKEVVAASASNRVVVESLKPKLTRREFYQRYVDFWRRNRLTKCDMIDDIPELNYTGKKLKRYLAVLKYYGVKKLACAYQTFMKKEALPMSSFLKKAVRLISPNLPLFLIATKNFFTAFEHKLLTTKNRIGRNLFAKQRPIHGRWTDILALVEQYRYVLCGDAKNFDASHRNASYLAEIDFYEWLGLDHDLAELMRNARTYGAIHHDIPMRHSGDLCTGSGNCLTIAACASTLPGDITIYCDGDDTLFFTNDPNAASLISDHFADSGFTMEIDDPIDLRSNDWTIEFCHVFYTHEGYSYDCERLLNRFGNIIGDDYDSLALTILGKLQSLPILEAAGCDFGFSVRELVRGDPENERDKYTMSQFEGMLNYIPNRVENIDLTDPESGFIAKVLLFMRSHRYYLRLLSDKRWKSKVLKAIKNMLEVEAKKQDFSTVNGIFKQADSIIARAGLKAITPILTSVITAQVIKAYDMDTVTYVVDNDWLQDHPLIPNWLGSLGYTVDLGAIKAYQRVRIDNGQTVDINLSYR